MIRSPDTTLGIRPFEMGPFTPPDLGHTALLTTTDVGTGDFVPRPTGPTTPPPAPPPPPPPPSPSIVQYF